MWKFSNSNSSCALWPPDAPQQQKSTPFFFPGYPNSNGYFSLNGSDACPGFGTSHGRILHLNSAFTHQFNPRAHNPANESTLGMGATTANGSSGMGFTTQMKRFLIFDHSGDRTNLIFSSMGNLPRVMNPTLPPTNETHAYASDCHEPTIEEHEEMHEDTEEIDALLYSDSENSFDSEEASTGHSPLGVEEDEECTSPNPAKRRKLEHSELDASLTDAASSAVVPCRHFRIDDDGAGLSSADSVSKLEENSDYKIACSKRERIQATVSLLRRIIPGGKGKGTAAVLDEAIRYLKSLKIQAEALEEGALMK